MASCHTAVLIAAAAGAWHGRFNSHSLGCRWLPRRLWRRLRRRPPWAQPLPQAPLPLPLPLPGQAPLSQPQPGWPPAPQLQPQPLSQPAPGQPQQEPGALRFQARVIHVALACGSTFCSCCASRRGLPLHRAPAGPLQVPGALPLPLPLSAPPLSLGLPCQEPEPLSTQEPQPQPQPQPPQQVQDP
jgi:hypothetical protein